MCWNLTIHISIKTLPDFQETQFCKSDTENVNKTQFLNVNTKDVQPSDISNYFSNTSKDSIFFDTVQKPAQSDISGPVISADSVISAPTFIPEVAEDRLTSQNSSTSFHVFSFPGHENTRQHEVAH